MKIKQQKKQLKDIYFELVERLPSIPGMEDCYATIINSLGSKQDTTLHWHHALELVLIMEGSCRYIVDSVERLTTVGEIHLINSGRIHSAINGDPNGRISSMVIEISDSYLKKMAPSEPLYNFYIKENSNAYIEIREDMYAILDAIHRQDTHTNFTISYRLNHILVLLYEHCRCQISHPFTTYSKKVIHYVNQHYMEEITVDDIARLVGLQKNYFCRCFRQETGLTFKYYLNRIRLDAALALLSVGKCSVLDAAIQVGYSSDKILLDWCKKVYHQTPMQYTKSRSSLSPDFAFPQ